MGTWKRKKGDRRTPAGRQNGAGNSNLFVVSTNALKQNGADMFVTRKQPLASGGGGANFIPKSSERDAKVARNISAAGYGNKQRHKEELLRRKQRGTNKAGAAAGKIYPDERLVRIYPDQHAPVSRFSAQLVPVDADQKVPDANVAAETNQRAFDMGNVNESIREYRPNGYRESPPPQMRNAYGFNPPKRYHSELNVSQPFSYLGKPGRKANDAPIMPPMQRSVDPADRMYFETRGLRPTENPDKARHRFSMVENYEYAAPARNAPLGFMHQTPYEDRNWMLHRYNHFPGNNLRSQQQQVSNLSQQHNAASRYQSTPNLAESPLPPERISPSPRILSQYDQNPPDLQQFEVQRRETYFGDTTDNRGQRKSAPLRMPALHEKQPNGIATPFTAAFSAQSRQSPPSYPPPVRTNLTKGGKKSVSSLDLRQPSASHDIPTHIYPSTPPTDRRKSTLDLRMPNYPMRTTTSPEHKGIHDRYRESWSPQLPRTPQLSVKEAQRKFERAANNKPPAIPKPSRKYGPQQKRSTSPTIDHSNFTPNKPPAIVITAPGKGTGNGVNKNSWESSGMDTGYFSSGSNNSGNSLLSDSEPSSVGVGSVKSQVGRTGGRVCAAVMLLVSLRAGNSGFPRAFGFESVRNLCTSMVGMFGGNMRIISAPD